MSRYTYKSRKLSRKEKFDIATMIYFIPRNMKPFRIYLNDKKKMADLSSKGIWPLGVRGGSAMGKSKGHTKGFKLLQAGKMYRDMQITEYKRDIGLGFMTKAELINSMPPRFRSWLTDKIQNVPADIEGKTYNMLLAVYREEQKNHGRN